MSTSMLTFTDGTNELQQCFNVTIIDDNLVEQQEVFTLAATPSSGSPATLLVFISNDDSKLTIAVILYQYHVALFPDPVPMQ